MKSETQLYATDPFLQGKLTLTIVILTADYTSKPSYSEEKAGSTFLLVFCISKIKKENQSKL